jgi:hypothetical protein
MIARLGILMSRATVHANARWPRIARLVPLCEALEESWQTCRTEIRSYRRRSFAEILATVFFGILMLALGCAPLAILLFAMAVERGAQTLAFTAVACAIGSVAVWLVSPRLPPWNVQGPRVRGISRELQRLLKRFEAGDGAILTDSQQDWIRHVLAYSANRDSGCLDLR